MVVGPISNSSGSSSSSTDQYLGIRDVWSWNLEEEMATIGRIVARYPYIAMDTEFPGVVGRPLTGASGNPGNGNFGFSSRADYIYQSMRLNVNMLKLIQLGLTFMDAEGSTPEKEVGISTWQFNFHFSLAADMYQEASIRLLTKAGIDFSRNDREGIEPLHFAALLIASGAVLLDNVTWIGFHAGYDFGYLLRMLTGAPELPPSVSGFFELLRIYFPRIYDLKYLVGAVNRRCGGEQPSLGLSIVKGGLSEIAKQLNITRKGPSHQAGSDSLLTGETFFRVRRLFFDNDLESFSSSAAGNPFASPAALLGTIYGLYETSLSSLTTPMTTTMITSGSSSSSNPSMTPSPPIDDDNEEVVELFDGKKDIVEKKTEETILAPAPFELPIFKTFVPFIPSSSTSSSSNFFSASPKVNLTTEEDKTVVKTD